MKERNINKWDHIKLLQSRRHHQKQIKRQPSEWEKIFANHISDMGLISETYKELIQLNNKNKQYN